MTSDGTGASTADYTAFKAFHDWALLQSGWVGLTLPPSPSGKYYGARGSYTFAANQPFFGIPKLVVRGHGAAMNGLHGAAFTNTNINTRAAIETVAAGSITVTLVDIEDADMFDVGGMVLFGGIDLQGFGYPPNPHYFEWRRIVAINGAVITLDEPLTNGYRSDWPDYFTGNQFELGGLGAGTIVKTLPGWDCHHKLFGIKSMMQGQTYYFLREVELFDVESSQNGWIIGASRRMKIVNQKHTTSNHEVDKLCERALIGEYGPTTRNIQTQSSSIGLLHIRGGTRSINGTARRTLIDGGSCATITLGPTAYGNSEYLVVRDREITAGFSYPNFSSNLGTDLTYEGDGIFRYVSESPHQWLVPGAIGYLGTASPFFRHSPFRVLTIARDGDDVLVQTTLTGPTLPEVSGYATGAVVRHNMPDITVRDCYGSAEALELSAAPANAPYGSFRKRTLDGLTANNSFGFTMGRLIHIKVNVVTPYTGVAGTLNLTIGGQFGTYVINEDMTQNRYQDSRVNLKVAGERVITPSGVTGAQTGDTNLSNFASALWLPVLSGFGAWIGNGSGTVDISGESAGVRPSVTVEVLTDQEIP